MPSFDRNLRFQQLYQPRRIGKRGGGVVTQGHERTTEAHASRTGVGDAELQGNNRLLRRGRARQQ